MRMKNSNFKAGESGVLEEAVDLQMQERLRGMWKESKEGEDLKGCTPRITW